MIRLDPINARTFPYRMMLSYHGVELTKLAREEAGDWRENDYSVSYVLKCTVLIPNY